jgi:glutamyl-tRNA synthetase
MPTHLYVGRINFEDLRVSASKTRKLIEKKKFKGWDDIRLPFLSALKRRGYQPDAFIKHAIEIGVSANDKTVSGEEYFETINKFNREVLDADANRYYFVPTPVKIQVEGAPDLKEVNLKIHPDKKKTRLIKTGKYFYISKEDLEKYKGKEIRLKGLFNIKLNKKVVFTSKENKAVPKIQWVSDDNIKIEVLMPNNKKIKGLAEVNVKNLGNNNIVQFERFGFVRKESNNLFVFGHK